MIPPTIPEILKKIAIHDVEKFGFKVFSKIKLKLKYLGTR